MVDIVFKYYGSQPKGLDDDAVLNNLLKHLYNNGVTPDQIFIKDRIIRSIVSG